MQLTCKTSFPGVLTKGKTYEAEYFNEDLVRVTDDTGKPIEARWGDFEPATIFKAGDKLVCTRRKAYQSLSAGDTYDAIYNEENGQVYVINDDGDEAPYDVDRFELAPAKKAEPAPNRKFKKGDRLLCHKAELGLLVDKGQTYVASTDEDSHGYLTIHTVDGCALGYFKAERFTKLTAFPPRKPFKFGEELVCKHKESDDRLTVGCVYIAIADEKSYSVEIRNDDGNRHTYCAGQFELKHDPVNRPAHYTDGEIEVIDYIEDKQLGYHLGNAIKYISRAGKKDPAKVKEDLEKAIWYIKRHIHATAP